MGVSAPIWAMRGSGIDRPAPVGCEERRRRSGNGLYRFRDSVSRPLSPLCLSRLLCACAGIFSAKCFGESGAGGRLSEAFGWGEWVCAGVEAPAYQIISPEPNAVGVRGFPGLRIETRARSH